MRRSRWPLWPWLSFLCSLALLPAQATKDKELAAQRVRMASAANAIRAWVAGFEQARLGPAGLLRAGSGLQPAYASAAIAATLLEERDFNRLTHLDVLQKLLFFAEGAGDADLADAVLSVAAIGLEGGFLDREALQLRELGHWSLLRMEQPAPWFVLMRAAAGERLPLLQAKDGEVATEPERVPRRVAALRALGQRGRPVFRSTIEAALADGDARVRLAAAEALEAPRWRESLPVLVRVLQLERHPVVSQALVKTLFGILRVHADSVDAAERERAMRAVLRLLGQCGWRTDMELMAVIEQFPSKAAIPELIDLLDKSRRPDALVDAVNRRATPRLRERAASLLRAMTGALIAGDDAAAWRAFWLEERDRIVVPDKLVRRDDPSATRARFFDVPVTGSEIAFVIDTSGSMDEAAAGTVVGGGRGRAEGRIPTRLAAAKEQLLLAVQAMDPDARYHLITFAGEAKVWSRKAVPPTPGTTRSLTETLSRLQAQGGTNVYDGLVEALQLKKQKFGELGDQRIDELFLLSDGQPTVGAVVDPEQLLQLIREANRYAKVRIHTVFTGTGPGADFLRRLAQENDGVFVQR